MLGPRPKNGIRPPQNMEENSRKLDDSWVDAAIVIEKRPLFFLGGRFPLFSFVFLYFALGPNMGALQGTGIAILHRALSPSEPWPTIQYQYDHKHSSVLDEMVTPAHSHTTCPHRMGPAKTALENPECISRNAVSCALLSCWHSDVNIQNGRRCPGRV